VVVRTCTLYRVYIYGREYRMRIERNGRNVQLGKTDLFKNSLPKIISQFRIDSLYILFIVAIL
jgi:hypothetical protein